MTVNLDCKNLACPEPVLMVKDALEKLPENGILDVELNSYSSIENVKRFAKSQNIYVKEKLSTKELTILTLVKGFQCEIEPEKNKKFYTLIIGSIVSAIFASSCCLAPLLFLLFGISVNSLSFLQIFAPYKWLFSIVSVIVIIYLWYDFYKKTKVLCSGYLCINYKKYLIIGTVFVLVFITYPYWLNYLLEII
ncbi:MAG TPA: mercury transporter MerT [Arcobacter sp.]|nr:mercury transporter MerT [Arcobacter sp.]